MSDRRVCILTEEWYETDGLEDLRPDADSLERYLCPVCDNHHNYSNGRPTLAPMTFECRNCGEPVGSPAGGGLEYCNRDCRREAIDDALETLEGTGLFGQ